MDTKDSQLNRQGGADEASDSDVESFWTNTQPHPCLTVRKSDYDALKAERDALREELRTVLIAAEDAVNSAQVRMDAFAIRNHLRALLNKEGER